MVDVPRHSKGGTGIRVNYAGFLRPRFKGELSKRLLKSGFSRIEVDDVMDRALKLSARGQSINQITATLVAERNA